MSSRTPPRSTQAVELCKDRSGISSATIKLVALGTMLVDHVGYFLYRTGVVETDSFLYLVMRCVGRVSFPLFCFLLAEGMERTTDRGKYLTRLLICAAASQIPYSMLFGRGGAGEFSILHAAVCVAILLVCVALLAFTIGRPRPALLISAAAVIILSQMRWKSGTVILLGENLNVLFTLSLSAMAICVLQKVFPEKGTVKLSIRNIAALGAAECILLMLGQNCSYSIIGVLLPVALWLCLKNRFAQLLAVAVWAGVKYTLHLPYLSCTLISVALICFYSGQYGRWLLPKRFLYWFYPAHLLALGALRILIAR